MRSWPFYPILLVAALASGVRTAPAAAQDVETEEPGMLPGEFEDPEGANTERSSYSTLFDQSDLGNVIQSAQAHYHAGQRELQSAEKLARKAEEAASEERRGEILSRRAAALERAAAEFVEAIGYDRSLAEAYVALGEAYRELGKNEQALEVHAAGLAVDPESEANFEGWANSLLALDRLGDAVAAHDSYSRERPQRARYLLDGMKRWLEAKQRDPGNVPPEAVQRLVDWLAQHDAGAR